MNLQKSYGWPITLTLSFFPIILWALYPSDTPIFSNSTTILAATGQTTALVGTAMFALNMILAARLKIIEKHFAGLNRVYFKHNLLGQIAAILLLIHPLLLIPKYAGSSIKYAAKFLWFSDNWPQNWGILALAIMILLIALTLYLRPKYNIWKITHKFFGLALFLATLHVWLIPSNTSTNLPLRFYILGLAIIGLMAFTYRSILGRFLIKKYLYQVVAIDKPNSEITEISLKPIKEKLIYQPGQFIFIEFSDPKVTKESHPFSISSSPDEETLKITIKNLGDYTQNISNLSLNSFAKIEGPFGVFCHENCENKNQIWIAGGIGITPFLGMAKSLKPNSEYQIDLYYCCKNVQEIIHKETLEQIFQQQKGKFQIFPFCSDTEGHLSCEHIEKKSSKLNQKDFFLCGPPGLITALKSQLINKNVPAKNIHSEEFNF